MCELTYANLHCWEYNSLMVYLLAKIGSEFRHDDGCGIMCKGDKIWKTKNAAHKITNLGEILYKLVQDNKPIPFHVRFATNGIEVTDENAHPFKGEHFILMHNGTLVPKNGEEPKDKKQDSDSLRFLKALDELKKKEPKKPFEQLFNSTMDNFAGKFAFIVRQTGEEIDYIIRGRTAELWISYLTIEGEKSGYVINTRKESLTKAFMDFSNIAGLLYGQSFVFTEPILLKEESIFIAKEDDIVFLGKSVENFVPKKESAIQYHNPVKSLVTSGVSNPANPDLVNFVLKSAKRVYDFLLDHSLDYSDFQYIFQVFAGISILELTREDINSFMDYIIPKLSADKDFRKAVKTALEGSSFPAYLYKEFNLEYPWMLNSKAAVLEAIKKGRKN